MIIAIRKNKSVIIADQKTGIVKGIGTKDVFILLRNARKVTVLLQPRATRLPAQK